MRKKTKFDRLTPRINNLVEDLKNSPAGDVHDVRYVLLYDLLDRLIEICDNNISCSTGIATQADKDDIVDKIVLEIKRDVDEIDFSGSAISYFKQVMDLELISKYEKNKS